MEVSTFTNPKAPHSAKKHDVKAYYDMSLNNLVQAAMDSLKYLKEKMKKTERGSVQQSLQRRIDNETSIAVLCMNIICKHHVEQPEGGLEQTELLQRLPAGLFKQYEEAGITLTYKRTTIKEEQMEAA